MKPFALPDSIKDRYIASFFLISGLIWVISFSLVYTNILDASNVLIIHFDSFKGADFFGERSDVFDIIVTAGIIWGINLGLAHVFYFRERFLSYVLAGATVGYMVLILLAVNAIISII